MKRSGAGARWLAAAAAAGGRRMTGTRGAGALGYAGFSGATTRWRSGSSPSEYVCTEPCSRRYSWTIRRSLGRHRVQRDRAALAQRVVGGMVGLAAQDHLAALAVALGVDDDPPAVLGARAADALGEMLHGVDRLAVAADEQPEVLAVHRARSASRRRR